MSRFTMMGLSPSYWAAIADPSAMKYRTEWLLLSLFSFLAGLSLPYAEAGISKNLALLNEISELIQHNALKPLDSHQLWEGAAKGLLASLNDPYSSYLNAQEYAELKQIKTGEVAGIGIEIGIRDGRLTIVSALDQSPAWKAGLGAGDRIRSINQKSTSHLNFAEAVQLMQGEVGTWVEIGIEHPHNKRMDTYKIQREVLNLNPVSFRMLSENIGYLRLNTFFSDQVPLAMQAALTQLETEGMQSLIFDLRNNPGGTLSNAIEVGSMFISQGAIVRVVDRQNQETLHMATGLPIFNPSYDVIVLINNGTASAAEIVAGSMQEHGRALLVGKQSFGKGLVQNLLSLSEGSGLSLTTSKYLTSHGNDIHGKGIHPDFEVDLPEGVQIGSEKDTQLLMARDILLSLSPASSE
ncbi:peptidase S41 [bacterium (Candidatus Blackallbacteria) CG17_big_fil_post_rev_8_21_14_2_50_48_46]|uniref:Peptidase S41 n=1 Tax=bacterium (Candidatus Blackallbacteria) CG17_big_fil_post_rev_8_21_14_2_50_48_46 TaxID=2014261 RepID=A0A2M7G2A1_9BACT|nr:MAG: peptidase S41 [bacterium (Candidatus Blackallbacteria) CG18_big_fil_WC_8_21_14_2_50_49_26]PIW15924.1 MAG: peptidase S41 [bacterium (Candidatus Blackallbacteria) CG17_big_fil_post_rev_8_21_14_2_50_48_46]PIW50336.1 MAG: peptidase S41 [bacterium (Candidatus Blackallbacteria) CG13_big_fil_rev_8_21_14_2_50_49_14]